MKINNKSKQDILFYLLIDFAFTFSVFLFIPYEVYLGNISEFRFNLSQFWMPCVLALGIMLICFIVNMLCSEKVNKVIISAVVGIMLAGYVQSMFLNGTMKKLDGIQDGWDTKTYWINLVIWIAVAIFPFLISLKDTGIWNKLCKIVAVMLVGMQGAALASLLITAQPPEYSAEKKLSKKGLLEVAEGTNVIVFCLDRFDQKYVERMVEVYPDSLDEMKGFIYYPNATGKYCYTHIGVPYLLTGETIPEYDPTDEQFREQIENSEYFNLLTENVGSIGVYTNEFCVRSEAAREKIDNCMELEYTLDKGIISKASVRASMYRILPFILKNKFAYSADNFNAAICAEEPGEYSPDNNKTEADMMKRLMSDGLMINEAYGDSAYRFIHLCSAHGPYGLDKECNYIVHKETDIEQSAAGTMKMIGRYCQELDGLGLFEDAVIIITADHGESRVIKDGGEGKISLNPIYMYKPKGVSRSEAIKTSLAPVAQDDIFATVLDAFGLHSLEYEYTIDDIEEDMERSRYFYWCYQDPEVTDYESCIHVEYEINGDSREDENWKETGNRVYPNNSKK